MLPTLLPWGVCVLPADRDSPSVPAIKPSPPAHQRLPGLPGDGRRSFRAAAPGAFAVAEPLRQAYWHHGHGLQALRHRCNDDAPFARSPDVEMFHVEHLCRAAGPPPPHPCLPPSWPCHYPCHYPCPCQCRSHLPTGSVKPLTCLFACPVACSMACHAADPVAVGRLRPACRPGQPISPSNQAQAVNSSSSTIAGIAG